LQLSEVSVREQYFRRVLEQLLERFVHSFPHCRCTVESKHAAHVVTGPSFVVLVPVTLMLLLELAEATNEPRDWSMALLMNNMLAPLGVHRCSFFVLRDEGGQLGRGSDESQIAFTG
jgi:hypothetical protein